MEIKESLLMPRTNFEMRGNLTNKEPVLIEHWDSIKLYQKMNENREGCEEFLLHDGPPYANGDIHCGHMLNRLLKDFVIRYKNMEGYKTPFVFGWDTHGLPIEVKVTKSGVNRKAMSVADFRNLCKEYAIKQVNHQKSQIHRLGCLGDYDHPYLTLNPEFEARQIDVFAKMALDGIIYKGVKPVYWSPSSESALAEAEVEYQDVTAKTLYVSFDFVDGKGVVPNDSKIIVWTTTPWTIPADLAITLNPRFEYGLFKTEKGNFVFLTSLASTLKETLGFSTCELLKTFKGQELERAVVKHPLYNRTSLVIVANFVTEDSGTGCVHTAPDHGVDDFNACLKYNIKPFCPVDERGYMHLEENDPCNGKFYADANDIVIEELKANGHLLKEVDIIHSYPHDWRTHKPVIYRATPQWFCSIEPIRAKLLEEVHKIKWEPAWGEEKMVNMIKDRNDWCISRQRSWGVPLPIIYNEDNTPIIDEKVFKHIRDIIAKEGSNAWFTYSEKDLLPEGYTNKASPHGEFRKETDIMDVWFDSGSSWNGVLRERGFKYPADLYLEGNDQYRGWFNASLILSTAYLGIAPFKSCLTHGWVMDENWNKMSKSAGNGIDPSKVANQFGADILRLWAASVNYETDVRISESIIATVSDQYRKIRNTFRFLLGNLSNGEGKSYVYPSLAPTLYPLDKWILGAFENLKSQVLKAYDSYNFSSLSGLLGNFLVDLSSFYLDFAKDILYCDDVTSSRREAVQYVIYTLSKELCLLYNPILPFTMDEVYKNIPGMKKESPQFEDMPKETHIYSQDESSALYAPFLTLRSQVLKSLEDERAKNVIGSALEAKVYLSLDNKALYDLFKSQDEEEVARYFGVSQIEVKEGPLMVKVEKALGVKCDRCRRIIEEKNIIKKDELNLCARCAKVLGDK
jgi:isoleucyl-tRNA synthetase